MKKVLLAASVIVFLATSCAQQKVWTEKEKETLRTDVLNHKEKSFLRHLEKENYANLEECVVTTVSETYPDYMAYSQMPAQSDSLVAVIVTCTSDLLGPNYENLPILFPPSVLQAQGVLPADFTDEQIALFYQSLANKIKGAYPDPTSFLLSLMNDPAVGGALVQAMQICVNELTTNTPQESAL